MSVIVWDGKVLSADSDINDGQVRMPYQKIWRKGKFLYGVVGKVSDCNKLRAWVDLLDKDRASWPAIYPESQLIECHYDGTSKRYHGTTPDPTSHVGVVALGSGRDFAYGALFMKASAPEAVGAAVTFSATCSGGVQSLVHDNYHNGGPNGNGPNNSGTPIALAA